MLACLSRLSVITILSLLFLLPEQAAAQPDFRSDFDSQADLADWIRLEVPGWAPKWRDMRVSRGVLRIWPRSSSWYEDHIGGFLYREIAGDFTLTARVRVAGLNGGLPQRNYSLAGLMVRSPRALSANDFHPGQENWMFLSLGTASPAGAPHYEVKTTQNSVSRLEVLPREGDWADLRIERQGSRFILSARAEGVSWRDLRHYDRPDMPRRLQLGMTVYADWDSVNARGPAEQANREGAVADNADMIAYFDWIEIDAE